MATAIGHGSPAYGTAPAGPAGGGLLVVIGPAGPERAALLLALGGRMRLPGPRRRVAVARAYGASAPDPYDRVGELLDLAAVHAGLRVGAPRIGEALAATGLRPAEHPDPDRPGTLPRGARFEHLPAQDQLLLAVTLALIPGPDLLLVDTPDDDAAAADRRVWERLRRIAATVTPVIATAPDAAVAGDYAHRTVVLPHQATP
jgi:hypothetical protein